MGIPLAHLVYVLTVTTAWNYVRNKTCNLPNGTYADLENTFSNVKYQDAISTNVGSSLALV